MERMVVRRRRRFGERGEWMGVFRCILDRLRIKLWLCLSEELFSRHLEINTWS